MKQFKIKNSKLTTFRATPFTIIIYFLLSTFYSNSQVVFNKIDSLYYGPNIRNVIVQDSAYFSVGGSLIDNIAGVVTCKSDLYGEIIETQYFGDSMFWYHGVENSLKETGTGNYILGGNRNYSSNYSDNLLIKFNSNFDTIFTRKIYAIEDNVKEVLTYSSCIDIDSNYLLVGVANIDNSYELLPQPCMQLIKTDTLGNLLWRKTYGDSNYYYYGYKVVPAFGGGYLLGGYSNKNGGDNCLIKVDENGENPIFKYFGHPTYDEGRLGELYSTKDSCYLLVGKIKITSELEKARILKSF
jgi:hypothetical protein